MRVTTLAGFIVAIIMAGVAVSVRPVHAVETSRLIISPVTFELSANPGETITNQIKITNMSDGDLQLQTSVENIAGTDDQGQVTLTDKDTGYALSSWIKTDTSIFKVAAKETKLLPFSIVVPQNAEPGGHFGTLLVGTKAAAIEGQTGVGFGQKVGSLLLLRVSGEAKEAAAVTKFDARQYTGKWDERKSADGQTTYLVPTSDVASTPAQKYMSQGPIAFNMNWHSAGNVHVKPVGYVTVYNIFHNKVAELPIEPKNIFPGNDRQVTVIWPQAKLWGVYYSATASAVYGSDNTVLQAQTAFWAFPLWAAIVILVVLVLIILLHKRFVRAFRILTKGT